MEFLVDFAPAPEEPQQPDLTDFDAWYAWYYGTDDDDDVDQGVGEVVLPELEDCRSWLTTMLKRLQIPTSCLKDLQLVVKNGTENSTTTETTSLILKFSLRTNEDDYTMINDEDTSANKITGVIPYDISNVAFRLEQEVKE